MSDTALEVYSDNVPAFELAQRQAKMTAASGIVPELFRGSVPNCLVAMDYASRLDLPVLAVMQALFLVHGKPGFEAKFLIAMVNRSGKFSPLRYRYFGDHGTDGRGCVVYAKDLSTGEDLEGPSVTVAMAKAEGWYDKKGSKWPTLTDLMLAYRAATFWARLYSPGIGLGLTVDEVVDMTPEPGSGLARELKRITGIGVEDQPAEPAEDPPPLDRDALLDRYDAMSEGERADLGLPEDWRKWTDADWQRLAEAVEGAP